MRSDSPPASWYEPADLIEIDDDEPFPHAETVSEPLVIAHGWATWTYVHDDTDD
jgi:hypothetical protein